MPGPVHRTSERFAHRRRAGSGRGRLAFPPRGDVLADDVEGLGQTLLRVAPLVAEHIIFGRMHAAAGAKRLARARDSASFADAQALGDRVAAQLLAAGGREILASLRGTAAAGGAP